jgi:glutaredoxin
MKKIFYVLIVIIIFIATFKLLSNSPKNNQDQLQTIENPDFIFYYGTTCPHCKVVEEFIAENQLVDKLKIDFKEVYEVSENQKDLTNKVQENCPQFIDQENGGIGVPFLFDIQEKGCIQGDSPIINFLKEKSQIND